jgi:putative DNA primase/helicase
MVGHARLLHHLRSKFFRPLPSLSNQYGGSGRTGWLGGSFIYSQVLLELARPLSPLRSHRRSPPVAAGLMAARAERGDVLIWTGEDGIADTLLPRLLAAGGDPGRVHFVSSMQEDGKPRPFDPATGMPDLVKAARKLPDLKLVILDPVVAAVSGDSHKNTETRRGLQPVVDLADQLDCAVLGITHLSKNTGGREPLERVAGSIAFGAVARVVLATVKPADTEEPRRLVRAKSNLGPDTGGFEYILFGAPVPGQEFNAQRVEWGEVLEGSARELMAVEQPDDGGVAADDAEEFLQDILKGGAVSTKEIKEAANAHQPFVANRESRQG